MPTITGPVVGLDSAAANRLEQIVESFEAGWQSEQRPDITAFLSDSAELRTAVLAELAVLDLEFRLRAGESARAEDYLKQFSDFPTEAIPDLVEAEYRGRRLCEPHLDVNEFLLRFPVHRSTLADRLQLTATSTITSNQVPEKPVIPGYDILELLGRGTTGIVYQARDQRLGRLVAIKLLNVDADVDQRERFRRESTAAAQMHHPNIIAIYEVGESNSGRPFLVLEFVPGGTLQTLLRAGPMSPHDSAAAIETLARTLAHAHDHGVVHRDLKPANILVGHLNQDSTDKLKIADFGLARTAGSPMLTKTGAVIGTPAYMAPEQADGQDATVQSDVYALGAVLYECLVGRPPFRGATVLETLDQVRHREPVRIRDLQPSVPHDLETIALKCLLKNPQQRYVSAQALAEDLARFRAGEPIYARPISTLERGIRWARRNPLLAGLTGFIAGLLIILMIGAIAFGIRQNQLATIADQHRRDADQAAAKERHRRLELRDTLDRMTSMALADLTLAAPATKEQQDFFVAALKQYEAFAMEGAATRSDQLQAVKASCRVADIQHRLGDWTATAHSYDRACAMADELARADSTDREAIQTAVIANFHRALFHEGRRDWEAARSAAEKTLEWTKKVESHPETAPVSFQFHIDCLTMLVRIHRMQGQHKKGREVLGRAQAALAQAPPANSRYTSVRRVIVLNNLANEAVNLGDARASQQLLNHALPLAEWLEANAADERDALPNVARTYYHAAIRATSEVSPAEKQRLLDRAIDVTRIVLQRAPTDQDIRCDLSKMLRERASSDPNNANNIKRLQEAVDLLLLAAAAHPNDFQVVRGYAQSLNQLGLVFQDAKQIDAARVTLGQSAEQFEKLLNVHPNAWEAAVGLGGTLVNRANLEQTASGGSAALPYLDRAVFILERATKNTAASPDAKRFLRNALVQRAKCHFAANEFADSLTDFDGAIALQAIEADAIDMRIFKGYALERLKRTVEARKEIDDALARPGLTSNHKHHAVIVLSRLSAADGFAAEDRQSTRRRAAELLTDLHRAGYFRNKSYAKALKNSPDFAGVRDDPEVQVIIAALDESNTP